MKNYIYLVCTAHSGSTLLAFLLGNHSKIATVGEIAGRTDYPGYRCSCGELLTECSFWQNVKKKMQHKGNLLDLTDFDIFIDGRRKFSAFDRLHDHYFSLRQIDSIKDYLFGLNKNRRKWLDSTVSRNILLAESITECYLKDHFFDTTKDLYRLKYLKNRLGSRFKVIYMTRDGRGVMNSLMNREKYSESQAIKAWIWSNSNIQRIKRNYFDDSDFFQLKYEELCKNPISIINEINQFVEVPCEKDPNLFNKEDFHVIGNFMRKDFSGSVSLDESWRKILTVKQLNLFDKVAGRMNRSLGYE
jgi:hypothetical protein